LNPVTLDNMKVILTQFRSEITESVRDAIIDVVCAKTTPLPQSQALMQQRNDTSIKCSDVFMDYIKGTGEDFVPSRCISENSIYFIGTGIMIAIGIGSIATTTYCFLKNICGKKISADRNPHPKDYISLPMNPRDEKGNPLDVEKWADINENGMESPFFKQPHG